jgi:precorrin-6B methylase 2
LDNNDIALLDGYKNNEILFKKIPYDARKTKAKKYTNMNEKFEVQNASVKRGDNRDILGKIIQEDAVILGKITSIIK